MQQGHIKLIKNGIKYIDNVTKKKSISNKRCPFELFIHLGILKMSPGFLSTKSTHLNDFWSHTEDWSNGQLCHYRNKLHFKIC